MKLAIKIMGLVFLMIIVLVTIDGYLLIQREKELFDDDMLHDLYLLGHVMGDFINDRWEQSGQDSAMQIISRLKQQYGDIKMRWVRLDATADHRYAPAVPPDSLETYCDGDTILYKKIIRDGDDLLYAYVPVNKKNSASGAIELSESFVKRNRYIRESRIRRAILAGIMLLVSGAILLIVGAIFIGKPLRQLVDKTQLIGESGNLAGDLFVYGRDELAELTIAMNRMCDQLDQARKLAQEETEKRIAAIEQLRHADRLATLGRLSSGIAHELGTPLNVVSGRAKMIATEQLEPQEVVEFANIIVEQTSRMTRIIRQLLDFARRRAVQRAPVNIINLTGQVIEMVQPIAAKNNVTIAFDRTTRLPSVSLDAGQIQQVLTNLIINGIQAMPDGGELAITVNIEATAPPAGENAGVKKYLAICVKDEGQGIPEVNLPHIFEPFFTTKGVGKGTGLGLSIAYGIVEEHGGWIDVQSEPEQGACFTIYLPLEETE